MLFYEISFLHERMTDKFQFFRLGYLSGSSLETRKPSSSRKRFLLTVTKFEISIKKKKKNFGKLVTMNLKV